MKATLHFLIAFVLLGTASAQEARYYRVNGPVMASIQALTPDGFITWTNLPTSGTFTVQTASSPVGESNWVDFIQVPVTNATTAIERLFDPKPPAGMVLIPAGSFTMGDTFNDGNANERPTHTVYVSAFNMDCNEVTKGLWDDVYQWAIAHGYSFDYPGLGKETDHPVHTVNWYDSVKWCNSRSEKEGRVPAYYTSATQTNVYRAGQVDVQDGWVKWDRGYRLPTEAEWEKAARGGMSGRRFPWGDTITHGQANYYSHWTGGRPVYAYDVNPTEGIHPTYDTGGYPYTSPVGSFLPNGYGLRDMAGNVLEWCWDRFGSYSSGSASDPRGPASGSYRMFRGGSWGHFAFECRTALHNIFGWPDHNGDRLGFRSVLPPGQ